MRVKYIASLLTSTACFVILLTASLMRSRINPVTYQSVGSCSGFHLNATQYSHMLSHTQCQTGAWPDLELFVPMPESMYDEFRTQLWASAQMFWPREHLKLRILLDKEAENVLNFSRVLHAGLSPFCDLRVSFNEPSPYYSTGHDRQQLVMFWADNFTTAEYVGFVDTDTVFISPVELSDIFENSKPIIFGFFGIPMNDWWASVPNNTFYVLRKPEAVRCMSYFPVTVRVEHLKELRAYLVLLHGVDFNELFNRFSQSSRYSQFNIICNYLWYYYRDQYVWYVREAIPDWVYPKLPTSPRGQVRDKETAGIIPSMLYPKPQVTVHWGYRLPGLYNLPEVLRAGNNFSCHAKQYSDRLQDFDFYAEQFMFELSTWTHHKDVCLAFLVRQIRQHNCLTSERVAESCKRSAFS